MSALRVACRTPWGDDYYDLVVLRGHVIVPRYLGHDRSLWWLGDEHHPHLAVTDLSVLEEETGAELGLSPYCVPIERWNEVARQEPWLPMVPASVTAGSFVQQEGVTVLPASPQLESLAIPRRAVNPLDLDRDVHDARLTFDRPLHVASDALSRLFGALRRLVVVGLLGAAILACVYYLLAATLWLWSLRNGMTGGKIQDGIMLIVSAALFSAVTGVVRKRFRIPSRNLVLPYRYDARDRQPLLSTLLDAYRLGITLQLFAFAGFIVW
jgi:hypothetical protein